MIDTRKLTSKIIEKTQDKESELIDELNNLEETKKEEKYLVDEEVSNIKNIDSLLNYFNNLTNTVDKLNFYKFSLFIMQDEEATEKLLKELKNLSLLNRTGLLDYAHEQENYSRQIISNFLLKLSNAGEVGQDALVEQEIKSINDKLGLIREFKSYFAPVGIVKEVLEVNRYNEYLDLIKLGNKDKVKALLMTLSFNNSLHNEELKQYEEVKEERLDEEEEPQIIEIKQEDDLLTKVEEANKVVKENKEKDPYELFNEYYEILLNNEDNIDYKEVIDKAKKYLDKNKKLISNLSDIALQDLNDTYIIYQRNEDLREEVYKTTENVERLLTFEIKKILEENDIEDNENLNKITTRLKPVVDYIDKKEKESKKK